MSKFTVQTEIGNLILNVTDGYHIYVTMEDKAVVRGVPYHGNFHIYQWSDRTWHIGMEGENSYDSRNHVYIRRSDRYTNDYPSDSALKKILEIVVPAVNEWAMRSENTPIFAAAQIETENDKIESINKDMQELKNTIDALEIEKQKILMGSMNHIHQKEKK